MAGFAAADVSIRCDELARIAARAAFLHERLGPEFTGRSDDGDSEAMLLRWRASLGPDGLTRRFDWDGIDAEAVEALLRGGNPSASEDEGWLGLLADALAWRPSDEPRRYLAAASPVAFEELLVPFVEGARAALCQDAGKAAALLSVAAQITLERSLLLLLSRLSLAVFDTEFALRQSLDGRFPWADGVRSDRSYRRFVADMHNGGLRELLREYPALARLLSSWCRRWAHAHAQLVRRLQADRFAIAEAFDIADETCRIEAISPYRSDPHDGGRAVSILTLRGGRLLVYKPRAVDMEQGLDELLTWANVHGFSEPYRHVRLLSRDGYGWMEHIACVPCHKAAQIDAFYRRMGGLLCLVSLLQGTDIHHENLIACGDQPVVVDSETLFHPRMSRALSKALGPGTRRGSDSDDFAARLSETGFVPSGTGPDFSALGAIEAIDTPFRIARCNAANSDAMAITYETFRVPRRNNVPLLDGEPQIAAAHTDSVVAGFAEMSALTLRHRASLVITIGRFAGRRGRVIARATNAYGLLLQASLQPELLRDGAARGIMFEQLRRAAVREARRPASWPILDAELRALERMEVPYLAFACDRDHACWPSPLEQVLARIAFITAATIDSDIAQLRQALKRLEKTAPPDSRAALPGRLAAAAQHEPLGG